MSEPLPPLMESRGTVRETALAAALRLHELVGDLNIRRGVAREDTVAYAETAIRSTAGMFAAWLVGTTRLRLTPGPVVDEATGAPTGATLQGDSKMQMNTGQKFTVECDTEDAAGFDTVETIEWSIDNGAVASITVSADTRTCEVVSGAPGSAVLTASLPNLDPPLSATLAVDVVPAGTATIELVPGDVVPE